MKRSFIRTIVARRPFVRSSPRLTSGPGRREPTGVDIGDLAVHVGLPRASEPGPIDCKAELPELALALEHQAIGRPN